MCFSARRIRARYRSCNDPSHPIRKSRTAEERPMSKVIANDSGSSTSVWMSTHVDERHGSFPDVSEVDVCIVGAGIAGISTAYELVLRGKRVIVLDDGPVGGGETARSTAHLTSALGDGFPLIQVVHR